MYKDTDYSGVSAVFVPGKYNMTDIMRRGLPTKSISSIKIPDGYNVKVYTEDGCKGDCTLLKGDIDLLDGSNTASNLQDRIVSFVVEEK